VIEVKRTFRNLEGKKKESVILGPGHENRVMPLKRERDATGLPRASRKKGKILTSK